MKGVDWVLNVWIVGEDEVERLLNIVGDLDVCVEVCSGYGDWIMCKVK